MKNVTITVDDPVLEWARIEAARRGTSVSRMVGDFLGELQRREDAYERAYLAWRTDERNWRSGGSAAACGFGRTPAQPLESGAEALDCPLTQPVFVDTAVLLAAEDGAQTAVHTQVRAALDVLWRERAGRVSSVVLAEFYEAATVHARPPMPQGDARAAIRRYHAWTPWQVDAATLETAWALQTRHQLAWGDCLSLAAAQHSGCGQLLSLALPHGALFGGVQVLHPQHCALLPQA
ncbi:Predicted nucleic acid-binding protein, contains PIN domain [Oryzisolibacter propanilivorax]|uniref:Ribonuclease VapC n=1 Tax=Oryzisolibacter propanilivorax TaxID=1527607 RepID=A0A1G9UWP0_9BURK|nr:Predicted nucleic acid-binding protein, contains PIN domain [Oryzisolibacter propanilivorax]